MIHSFDTDVAKEIGVNAAIILNNIYFWTEKNRANGKHIHDGKAWTYNSKRAFAELFPYFTERQIEYALSKLRESDLIVTGNYNASPYDKTLWYAITEKGFSILQHGSLDSTKLWNQNNENVEPIPDIKPDSKTTDIKPDIKDKGADALPSTNTENNTQDHSNSKDKKNKARHKYGAYQNVLFTDDEYETLKAEFPYDYQERVERVSEYVAATGKKYKNFLAVIRNWAKKDGGKKYGEHGKNGWANTQERTGTSGYSFPEL